jgi:hypothetical protein
MLGVYLARRYLKIHTEHTLFRINVQELICHLICYSMLNTEKRFT